MEHAHTEHGQYYVPHGSHWPITATTAIFLMFVGAASYLNGLSFGPIVGGLGFLLFLYMLFGWFGTVIGESEKGLFNDQVDVSFRWGMTWFIFSEVMFFAAFFGALYYARMYSVPWLGGEGNGDATNEFLHPGFLAAWPLQRLPDAFGFTEFKEVIGAWGVPALNTAVLLSSGFTVTMAHWALKDGKRAALIAWLVATVALGVSFLGLQASEYGEAYTHMDLTLNSGIYGATFFMLTGFHGFHVTLGAIMLSAILARCIRGHFTPKRHFAFEAVSWYWHFVDVVWLGLFIFVYWL
jgi:cytochrome c oxidase subunit 3